VEENKMQKKVSLFIISALILGGSFFGLQVNRANARGVPKILEFETMVGVPRPYTGATNAIRGVPGGGQPWIISYAQGELSTNGKLEVTVNGLVLVSTGANPVPNFKAIVSCLSKDAEGSPTTVNVTTTGLFPASVTGDAKIEETVVLPSPCIAPIVFVTNPNGSWFAATGQ
jgi:hypothetical protein